MQFEVELNAARSRVGVLIDSSERNLTQVIYASFQARYAQPYWSIVSGLLSRLTCIFLHEASPLITQDFKIV